MKRKVIDINCDVGEGIGNEASLFPYITSCSIACGGHAGDTDSMREVARLAKKFGLKVGAHPSYPDRENFGRLSMDLSPAELSATLNVQLGSLTGILAGEGVRLHHIKPHGALYNDLAADQGKAAGFLDCISRYRDTCGLYVPFGSVFALEAEHLGFRCFQEAFGDRRYLEGHKLAPRAMEGAVLLDPAQVFAQVVDIVQNGSVRTLEGKRIDMEAHTVCIHGDTPTALQILMYLAEELPKRGIYLKG